MITYAKIIFDNEFRITTPDETDPTDYNIHSIFFKPVQRQEFENMVDAIGIRGVWYEDNSKISNIVSYDSEEQASIDANNAAKKGWMPQSTSSTDGHVNVGRTVGKTILTGGIGLAVLGESRSKGKVTITYARTPEWSEAHKEGGKNFNSSDMTKTVPAASDSNDIILQLERLAKLKEQGILTEEELQTQKKKILGM